MGEGEGRCTEDEFLGGREHVQGEGDFVLVAFAGEEFEEGLERHFGCVKVVCGFGLWWRGRVRGGGGGWESFAEWWTGKEVRAWGGALGRWRRQDGVGSVAKVGERG